MPRQNSRSARAARGEQLPRARRRRSRNVRGRLDHMNENLRHLKGASPQSTLTRARKEWERFPKHHRLMAIKSRRNAEEKARENASE